MIPRCRSRPIPAFAVAAAVWLAACSSGIEPASSSDASIGTATQATSDGEPTSRRPRFRYPPAPAAPAADAPTAVGANSAIDAVNQLIPAGQLDVAAVVALGDTGDARHAWYLADVMRFFGGGDGDVIVDAFEKLTGASIADDPESARSAWLSVSNHLIAWDTPAYPGYRDDKAAIFLRLEPKWTPFFTDDDAAIDWRHLSWGGVFIDDRELESTASCPGSCIPSLDDPATTDAAGGEWYPAEGIVFGLVEGDESLAIPKNIAEIHEMFNLTLAGRRFGVPYCTLCGSAQAYYTDNTDADEQPVLRTSGLLIRSNKVMYDLTTMSVFDTFTGEAVSGPLHDQRVTLEEVTVVRSTWGEWKVAHPDTRIIAADGGIGRTYEFDPLNGRDDNGPIFPIGAADERLDVQELVVGVIGPEGTPLAFPSRSARSVLAGGGTVSLDGVSLIADGGGLRARDDATGETIAAHEVFWFAWSQFHPDTLFFGE